MPPLPPLPPDVPTASAVAPDFPGGTESLPPPYPRLPKPRLHFPYAASFRLLRTPAATLTQAVPARNTSYHRTVPPRSTTPSLPVAPGYLTTRTLRTPRARHVRGTSAEPQHGTPGLSQNKGPRASALHALTAAMLVLALRLGISLLNALLTNESARVTSDSRSFGTTHRHNGDHQSHQRQPTTFCSCRERPPEEHEQFVAPADGLRRRLRATLLGRANRLSTVLPRLSLSRSGVTVGVQI